MAAASGNRGPLRVWCRTCAPNGRGPSENEHRHSTPTCKRCGCLTGRGKGGWPIRVCGDCKKKAAQERARRGRINQCQKCSAKFKASSKQTKFCPSCRPTAEMMTCVICGTVRKRSAAGGNHAGLCCSKKCGGVLLSRRAKERARVAGGGLRSLLVYVKRLVERDKKNHLRAFKSLLVLCARLVANEKRGCLHCGGLLDDPHCRDSLCSDECKQLRQRSQRRDRRKPGNRKHGKRAALRGLPRSYSKAMMIQAVGDRDGWICQLCREVIEDNKLREGSRAPCIDHIVPLNHRANTRHGHTPENVQIAHRSCNEAKGCSVACMSLFECENPREWLKIACVDQTPPGGGLSGGLLGRKTPGALRNDF